MTLLKANRLADELTGLFRPFCDRWEIAGSIRREKSEGIKDVEIVAVPKLEEIQAGLFGEPAGHKNLLLEALNRAIEEGLIQKRKAENSGQECWGPRHQRAVYQGEAVDIFQVLPPAQWGVILTIRTGPADYSRSLVTPQPYGMMPPGMRVKDGGLYRGHDLIPTPEEEDFFAALGIPWLPPSERKA